MILVIHTVIIPFMVFFRVINTSVATDATKINHYISTIPVWMIVSCLISIGTNGIETSVTILAHMVGTSTGMERAEPIVIIPFLLSIEMVNITANTRHLSELANICIITEQLTKVAYLH